MVGFIDVVEENRNGHNDASDNVSIPKQDQTFASFRVVAAEDNDRHARHEKLDPTDREGRDVIE